MHTHFCPLAIYNCTIDIDDLNEVLDAVETLSAQWSLLCTRLGVKQSTLRLIETNHPGDVRMCLYKALGEWLSLNYNFDKHGRPSWRKLAEAVKSFDYALFKKIADTHRMLL